MCPQLRVLAGYDIPEADRTIFHIECEQNEGKKNLYLNVHRNKGMITDKINKVESERGRISKV